MTRKYSVGSVAKRYAVVAAALVALATFGALGVHELSIETAQARGLITHGQTELRDGRRAEAIVSFERARLLAPRADFVHTALHDAGVTTAETTSARAANWIAPREWSFLLVSFGWAAGLSLAVAILRGENGRAARRVALAAGLLFLFSAAGVVESSISARSLRVVNSPTGMLVAPYQGAGATADLAPGVVVAVGARYGEFIQVCDSNGARGWIAAKVLEAVVGS